MPPTEEPTLGEISRHLESVARDVREIKAEMKGFPDWEDMKRFERTLEARITAVESWQSWAIRITLGAVILATLGIVIGAKTGLL